MKNGTMFYAAASTSYFSCFFPNGLTPRTENVTCPTPLKIFHFSPSNTLSECVDAVQTADPV